MTDSICKAEAETGTEGSKSGVERLVMPVKLTKEQILKGTIYIDMLREDLAQKHFSKSLDQIAIAGGVTPSQTVAIKDHRWNLVSDDVGLGILNHCFEGGWA